MFKLDLFGLYYSCFKEVIHLKRIIEDLTLLFLGVSGDVLQTLK